jgi:hypothetical protein
MTFRGFAKGAGILMLALLTFGGLWAGIWWLGLADGWSKLWGVAVLAAVFRTFIFILDTLFGRPPQFSDRPWERPWEQEDHSL